MPTSGNVLTGSVVSGMGAGPYTVALTNSSGSGTVSAMIPQIDPSQTVPPGTNVILVSIKGNYFFQPAVWLAPSG